MPGAKASALPKSISPMLAELRPKPFSGDEWVFEPKLDGFRTIAYLDGGNITLRSRNDTDMTGYFPAVVSDLKNLGSREIVLDGEIVAIDDKGKPCFQCLQQHVGLPHEHTGKQFSTVHHVFDIIYLDGFNLMGLTWEKRNALLGQVLQPGAAPKAGGALRGRRRLYLSGCRRYRHGGHRRQEEAEPVRGRQALGELDEGQIHAERRVRHRRFRRGRRQTLGHLRLASAGVLQLRQVDLYRQCRHRVR